MEYWGFDVVCEVFVLLAGRTALDVFCDPSPSAGPEVFLIDALNCFVSPWVSVGRSLMLYVH
jgi:hypothetical protein